MANINEESDIICLKDDSGFDSMERVPSELSQSSSSCK